VNRTFIIFVALALVGLASGPAIASTYFPTRPANARLYYVTGVLTHYGLGNDSGTITTRDSAGAQTDVKMARTMMIDGAEVLCTVPGSCAQWPRNIRMGSTIVTLTCWLDSGWSRTPMLVSDHVDIGTLPQARRRKGK
jgi:hypothetical protein